jgi:methyltransferase (TIGR00027 family)
VAPFVSPGLAPELHTTGRPSSTAQWTTLGRALELGRAERIVTDVYAPVFLTPASRVLFGSLDAAGPVFRRAERLPVAGLATSGLCRHAFVDALLVASLPSMTQVVILGAGYDTRAYRFADEIEERPVYEVDLPPLSQRKAALVARELFGHASVRRVEIDFRRESLPSRLGAGGFDAGAPTFVAWEGVSMYLTRAAVDATLAALARICGPGSVLAMDFWQQVGGVGGYPLRRVVQGGMRLIGEPITCTVDARSAGAVLARHGFELIDLADSAEMTARYATGGRRCDPGMYVVAARLA